MNPTRKVLTYGLVAGVLVLAPTLPAVIPPTEKLLPEDTLLLVTTPDFARLGDLLRKSPQGQLWNDPAMKPFKDKFLGRWREEIVTPLERELDVKFSDYTALFQGQATFALIQNGWKGQAGEEPGFLLLVDARDKSDLLKRNLAGLRKKWTDAGKSLKTEKIRDREFMVLPLSSNDVPKTLRKFFPKTSEAQELGDDKQPQKTAAKDELVIGQADSLLVLANSPKAAEAVVARLGGGSLPSLAEYGSYQSSHLALFRDAPLYGWANVKRFVDVMLPVWSEKKENADAPNPFDIAPEKILNALGFSGLRTIATSFRQTPEGNLSQLFFSVPEADRQGLFKILAGEPKEANPPPFVPADALKFQRWRIDGRKAWATLEKILAEISPQAVSALNLVLDSANGYAQQKDPGFDIRKNLIGNLGDDVITLRKRPPASSGDRPASEAILVLVASPNAEQFVAALRGILVFMSQQASAPPQEREFLGRKIFSVPLAIPGRTATASANPPMLHYAAGGGYVALSAHPGMVEEYFRACDSPPKALRQLTGLAEAAQKVTGPSSSLFGYANDAERMRAIIEVLRKTGGPETNSAASSSLLPLAVSLGGSDKIFKEWLDFSQLPSFDKISKYFYFTVYGGSTTVDGLTFKMFSPPPPALKP